VDTPEPDSDGGAGLALTLLGERLEIGGEVRSSQDLEEADLLWSSSSLRDP